MVDVGELVPVVLRSPEVVVVVSAALDVSVVCVEVAGVGAEDASPEAVVVSLEGARDESVPLPRQRSLWYRLR